jgi:hypothetical protein
MYVPQTLRTFKATKASGNSVPLKNWAHKIFGKRRVHTDCADPMALSTPHKAQQRAHTTQAHSHLHSKPLQGQLEHKRHKDTTDTVGNTEESDARLKNARHMHADRHTLLTCTASASNWHMHHNSLAYCHSHPAGAEHRGVMQKCCNATTHVKQHTQVQKLHA